MNRIRHTGLIAVALTSGLLAVSTGLSSAQTRPDTPRAMEMPNRPANASSRKQLGNPAHGKSGNYSEDGFGCLITPHTAADIGAGAPGILAEVRVKRGDRVRRGQILAVLDNSVEQALLLAAEARAAARAEIAAARATHQMAQRKVARMKSLNELSYGAQLELELAEGELDVATYRIEQARERHRIADREHQVAAQQLDQRYVRSPIDGVVAEQMVSAGERADGRTIARVIRLDMLRVEVVAPARYYGRIAAGMIGTVNTETAEPMELTAIVDQVDAFIDPASSTFRAQMLVDNSALTVPAGARCRVSFDTGPAPAARS